MQRRMVVAALFLAMSAAGATWASADDATILRGRQLWWCSFFVAEIAHQAMDDKERERRALARDVQTAAERNELELHYQLQMTLGDGQVCGAEALMRWHHPQRGMVSPVASRH